MKVRVAGAELAAGEPADALEAGRSSTLRLHYNGTHRCSALFESLLSPFCALTAHDVSSPCACMQPSVINSLPKHLDMPPASFVG
jgi:hypothetical protein